MAIGIASFVNAGCVETNQIINSAVRKGMPAIDQRQPVVNLAIRQRRPPAWKRACDMVVGAGLLVFLTPVSVAIGLWIKCVSRGPVFFKQPRVGHGGRYFEILKFRTMHLDDNATTNHREYVRGLQQTNSLEKPSYESRLISGGSMLRRLSLDELPQIWNVLWGEMSLVGPRPDVLELADYESDWELRRFEVQPGITGLWQVSGKNSLSYEQMIELDVRYIDGMSLWLDAKILMKTFRVLVSQDNN